MNPIDPSRSVQPQAPTAAVKPAAAASTEKGATIAGDDYQASDVRVVTYNTAVGASKIKTPQADFTQLPIYQKALTNAPGAPIMALQEVGKAQLEAAKKYEAQGTCKVIYQKVHIGDQYNAIIVPARYTVESSESTHYLKAQIKAIGRGVWGFVKSFGKERPRFTDMHQPRGFLETQLKDSVTGKRFTLFDTHMALDPKVREDQIKKLVSTADAATKKGGVIIAGDLNTRNAATDQKGAASKDAPIRAALAGYTDMGASTEKEPTLGHSSGNIDWVLAKGFDAVSSRMLTDIQDPKGRPTDEVSDHRAEDDVLRFKP